MIINVAELIKMLLNGLQNVWQRNVLFYNFIVTDQKVSLSEQWAFFFHFQELEFTNMQQVLTVMHAFYAAKVAQVDPNFSFDNSF